MATTLTDSLIVIGGGLSGAMKYIKPALLKELRSTLKTIGSECVRRVQPEVFDLDNEDEFAAFVKGNPIEIKVYGSDDTTVYDTMKRTGVIVSKTGAIKSISTGAYVYALSQIDNN